MKKILFLTSLVISLLFSESTIMVTEAASQDEVSNECDNPKSSVVKIVDKYQQLINNGFIYTSDELYNYIVTSSDAISISDGYDVIYPNGYFSKSQLVGIDSNNQIAVIKTDKENEFSSVCLANTNYLYKGQTQYAYGYNDDNSFIIKTYLNQIGTLYAKKDYVNIYKNIVQIQGYDKLKGTALFDELGRLTGMITNFDENFNKQSFVIETDILSKVANLIIKSGNYKPNYIKYKLEDYTNLSNVVKKNYDINKSINKGVVVITFKPLNYIFGGLNQGMTIVAINGVEIKNGYQLDKQLLRYEKDDKVCLTVIKKNGKQAYYYLNV